MQIIFDPSPNSRNGEKCKTTYRKIQNPFITFEIRKATVVHKLEMRKIKENLKETKGRPF